MTKNAHYAKIDHLLKSICLRYPICLVTVGLGQRERMTGQVEQTRRSMQTFSKSAHSKALEKGRYVRKASTDAVFT